MQVRDELETGFDDTSFAGLFHLPLVAAKRYGLPALQTALAVFLAIAPLGVTRRPKTRTSDKLP